MEEEIKTHFKLQSFLNMYMGMVLEKVRENLGTTKE